MLSDVECAASCYIKTLKGKECVNFDVNRSIRSKKTAHPTFAGDVLEAA